MTKNLITGGLGFIGFHLTNLLLEKGEEVTIFEHDGQGHAHPWRYQQLVTRT